jgi:hypothetical protein
MYIPLEILNSVKNTFADLIEYGKKSLDLDYPYFNCYEWKGEYIFSLGHKDWNEAVKNADQELFYQDPNQSFNAIRNGIYWRGVLNAEKLFIPKNNI